MNKRELRAKILAYIPRDRAVAASDVVATLRLPQALVWSEIVVMAMEGIVTTDTPRGAYDGRAMVRRLAP